MQVPPNERRKGIGPIKACMVTYSFYENDGRVKRYAETLARRGGLVDIISLRKANQSSFEAINGVNVYRIQERIRDEESKISYLIRLLRFLIHSTLFLSRRYYVQRYDLVHVHSIPDFEVFAAILPRIFGA